MIRSKYLKSVLFFGLLIFLPLQNSIYIVSSQQEADNAESNDKPLNFDSSNTKPFTSFLYSWWADGILVTGITIISSIVVYYIVNFFLDKTAK